MSRCPSCNAAISVSATVPKESRMVMELKKPDDSEWFSADTIGGVISGTDKLLKMTAKNCGGNVSVFIFGITMDAGSMRIEFAVVNQKRQEPKRKKTAEVGKESA